MIDINFKYVLIAFFILVISSCAIVLLTINGNDESSSMKLITSVTESSETSDSTDTSQTRNKDSSYTKESKKTTGVRRTTSKTTTASKKTSTTTTHVKFPLDINKATKDELMEIDGVGEVTASKILSYRKKLGHYSNLIQLKEVDGIGDVTYKKLRKYLYVTKDKFKEMTEPNVNDKNQSVSKKTKSKAIKYKTTKAAKTSQTATEKKMKMVNINTADKEELMDSLLLNEEQAAKIIDLRESIGGQFTKTLEIVYEIGKSEYNRIKDYIIL